MNNIKKIAVFLVLLAFISVCSFAESFYSLSSGLFRSYDQYFNDNYSREQDGINFLTSLNYFPARKSWGWFITASAGVGTSGFELTESGMSSLYVSTTGLHLGGGPSYKIISGQTFVFPVSFGPVFSNYREEDYFYDENDSYIGSIYEAIDIGLQADAAVFITPLKWFTIRTGITITWDFLRFERGNILRNSSTYSSMFNYVNYMAVNLGIYSGIGIRF